MTCGLRRKAAGVKSRQSGDCEVIIRKRSMGPQHESPGRDTLGRECLLRMSASGSRARIFRRNRARRKQVFPIQAAAGRASQSAWRSFLNQHSEGSGSTSQLCREMPTGEHADSIKAGALHECKTNFALFVKASAYVLSLEAVRNELARPRRESVKINHFDGSKLYQRGPLR